MQPILTDDDEPFIVVAVLSHPSEFDERNAIRETWASTAEILNMGISRTGDSENILNEGHRFGDLLITNFLDSYRNLTILCVTIFFKTDSDVLVFPDKLAKFASSRFIRNNTIYGHLWHNAPVIRDADHKWQATEFKFSKYDRRFVNSSAYSPDYWPDYVSGGACLMSFDIIGRLLQSAHVLPFCEIEDVYFTGVLAEVRRKLAPGFELKRRTCFNPCVTGHVISSNGYNATELRELWATHQETGVCDSIDKVKKSIFC